MKFSKIFLFAAALAAGVAFSSCTKELGTVPGSETAPKVTFYQYDAPDEYNQDESLTLRVVPNGKVTSMYLYKEPKADKEAYIAANGEAAYAQKVVSEGTKYGGSDFDVVLSDIQGLYAITVVAENESEQIAYETTFKGILWVDGGTAMFYDMFTQTYAQVKVVRHDDENVFKVVNPCGQVGIDTPYTDEVIIFAQEKGEEVSSVELPSSYLSIDDNNYYWYAPSKYASYCYFETDLSGDAPVLAVVTLYVYNGAGYYSGGEFDLVLDGLKYFE